MALVCPSCNAIVLDDAPRCRHCWSELRDAERVDRETAEGLAGEQERARDARRRVARRRRAVRLAGFALVALVLASAGYAVFLRPPQPLPQPADAARMTTITPDAWPSADADTHGARSTPARVDPTPSTSWRVVLDGALPVAPVVDREAAYLALEGGGLIALSTEDGAILWRTALRETPWQAPVLAGDRLYFALPRGSVTAIGIGSGSVAWERDLGRPLTGAIAVDGGTVYVIAPPQLVGVDAERSDELWRRELGEEALAALVLDRERIAVASTSRATLYDRTNGAQTYWYSLPPVIDGVALRDGSLYVASSRAVVAIDAIDSRRPWWEPFRGAWFQFWVWGSAPEVPPPPSEWVVNRSRGGYAPAVGERAVFVADTAGDLTAYERADGSVLWERSIERPVLAPIVTAGALLVPLRDALLLLALDDGRELGRITIEGAGEDDPLEHLAVTEHGIYIVLRSSTVLALR